MTSDQLRQYIETVSSEVPPFYVDRRFQTNEEWDRVSAYEFRNTSLSGASEGTLDQLLGLRSVVVLGEPGSGKSMVARAAVGRVVARGWVPLFARLRSYVGQMSLLLNDPTASALLVGEAVDGAIPTRVLILDGFDELRLDALGTFVEEVSDLLFRQPSLRLFLTSRQAFHEANRNSFANQPERFYILDFNDKNVREYVGHHGGQYEDFIAEVNRVDLGQEIANPFALGVVLSDYRAHQTLGRLRTEAVGRVVNSLIDTRPELNTGQQHRALRMIAVAMESASRNELTLPESIQLLRTATTMSEEAAERLLNHLAGPILIRILPLSS